MNISRTLKIKTLSDKKEIQYIFKKGQKIHNKFGLIFLLKSFNENIYKVGILVKKNSGIAVKRNYIKRIIRQFVRDHYSVINNYNGIIFLYDYKGDISYKELSDIFLKCIKQYEKNITSNN